VVVGDQLPAALKRIEQLDRPVLADQPDRSVDLDNRQPPASRRDRITLVGVRLLAHPQRIYLGLPTGAIDNRGKARRVSGRRDSRPVRLHRRTAHRCLLALLLLRVDPTPFFVSVTLLI
jgi:hypothetical protein